MQNDQPALTLSGKGLLLDEADYFSLRLMPVYPESNITATASALIVNSYSTIIFNNRWPVSPYPLLLINPVMDKN